MNNIKLLYNKSLLEFCVVKEYQQCKKEKPLCIDILLVPRIIYERVNRLKQVRTETHFQPVPFLTGKTFLDDYESTQKLLYPRFYF